LSDPVKYLQIGDVLQLQFTPPGESQDRYAASLVGFLPGQSLIITTPRKNGNPIIVREGQAFTMRMLHGSNIFGFVTRVLKVSTKPYPHLHLAYPSDVESAVVRNAARIPTEIQAIVNKPSGTAGTEDQRPVIISDISVTGARLRDRQKIGDIGHVVQVTHSLFVCGGEDVLKVMGVIRNIREVKQEDGSIVIVHGIEFRGLTRFQVLLLCAYVHGSIARERG
jgi:c-di-GMP-binding flagellar brake protein YcgR